MKTFVTPTGKAGCDQIDAMEESVQTEIEQMFSQSAKRAALEHAVGRTGLRPYQADGKIQLDAQKRECEAQVAFHAGRALELAMHLVYARGADRILGREYPGVDSAMVVKDRRSHSLLQLYGRIITELTDRDMASAFEDVYLESLHCGVFDIYLDDNLKYSFKVAANTPFREISKGGIMDGAELTLDHSQGFGELLGVKIDRGLSKFEQMPHDTFEAFLKKTDAVYYEADSNGTRKNIRWAHYSSRDHEYGRPYVIVGCDFFARLVCGVVGLSHEPWTWDEGFARRWHARSQYIIGKLMRAHLKQNYEEDVVLPEMKSIESSMLWFRESVRKLRPLEMFDLLHTPYKLTSEPEDTGESEGQGGHECD